MAREGEVWPGVGDEPGGVVRLEVGRVGWRHRGEGRNAGQGRGDMHTRVGTLLVRYCSPWLRP